MPSFAAWLTALALAGSTRVLPWDDCTWPDPKPDYSQDLVRALLHIERVPRPGVPDARDHVSRNTVYYFRPGDRSLLMCGDKRECLSARLSESHRPLEARWVTEKLLLVETSFNPRAWAYWLVDVERETIVHSEHALENLPRWLKCHGPVTKGDASAGQRGPGARSVKRRTR
jgi:hypothetical protein